MSSRLLLAAASAVLCFTAQLAIAQANGAIQGKVTDVLGAAVGDAVVTVEGVDGNRRTTVTDAEGMFQISSLPVAKYKVKISANGFSDWTASNVPASLDPQSSPLTAVLQVATKVTTVTVGASPQEVAKEQLNQELKQRALIIFPNYYVTYERNPAPLSPTQKLHLGFKMLIDPSTFAAAGITAGIQQARNSYREFGQGFDGYAKRYGAAYGIGATGIIFTTVVANSVFHQDPRYVYSGQGTKKQRAWYAVKSAFLARGDNGKWQPPYATVTGIASAAELSQVYLPGYRTQITVLGRAFMFRFIGLAAVNLGEEFVLKKVTSNQPVQVATNGPVLREGTPVALIAVDGFGPQGASSGGTVRFVLAQDVCVDGKVLAKTGDFASGQVGQVNTGSNPNDVSSIALERVNLHAGSVNVPLRSSQQRGAVSPMQYKELPDSGKFEVKLFVAQDVQFGNIQ